MTCRVGYVDFDGELLLGKAMNKYPTQPLTDDFLNKYCEKILDAMDKLETWLERL